MAIIEYEKNGKKVYKVYVQFRGKSLKHLRVQKVLYSVESLAIARREERRLIKELAEKLAKLEGKGLLWSEVIDRWELAGHNNQLGSKLNRFTIADHVNRLKRYTKPWLELIASDLNKADGRRVLAYAESKDATASLLNKIKSSINLVYNWGLAEKSPVYGLGIGDKEE